VLAVRRTAPLLICFIAALAWAGPASAVDRDRDKVFDDLEARVAPLSDSDQVNVIVVMRERALPAQVDRLRAAAGLDVSQRFSLIDAVAGRVTKGRLRALASHPLVEHVERNSPIRALNNTAQSSFGVAAARTNAPAIDGNADGNVNTYSPSDMVAAVIDTGIDAGHGDLNEGKVIAFRDFVNNINTPYDDHGHGTHVSATLAGEGDARADLLYRGVAPGAALVGVKILDRNGNGTSAALISALQWVVANRTTYGIEAVNLSLGTAGCSDGADADSLALEAAHDAGLVMATAAGNEGPGQCTVGSPGAAPKALTVGAMADMGPLGFFQSFTSSRGKTFDGRVKPDVSAPGYQITSADSGTTAGYVVFSGTSMATPFVAGVALLMRETNPALTPQNVKDKIMQTAEDWGRGANNAPATTGPDPEYGAGKLDSYAAIKSAGAPLGSPPPGAVHAFREGTLPAQGAQIDYPITVRDTRFPIAATLIIPQIVGASAISPDFDVYLLNPSGTTVAQSAFRTRQEEFGFMPSVTGTYIVRVRSYRGSGGFFVDISAGLNDPGFVRPLSASPVRAALVPAYVSCSAGSANRTHGPPLAHPSCSPPAQIPGQLTVGTPDSNGQTANFDGSVVLRAVVGAPGAVPDEADVSFRVDATDVRRRTSLADYAGELETRLGIRLTDRLNGTSATDSATVQDFAMSFAVPCTITATAAGADCSASTSSDALTPGSVVQGKRAVWELAQVQVFDGGPDDTAATQSGNALFAVQGVFVP
jgi:serine protease AprX